MPLASADGWTIFFLSLVLMGSLIIFVVAMVTRVLNPWYYTSTPPNKYDARPPCAKSFDVNTCPPSDFVTYCTPTTLAGEAKEEFTQEITDQCLAWCIDEVNPLTPGYCGYMPYCGRLDRITFQGQCVTATCNVSTFTGCTGTDIVNLCKSGISSPATCAAYCAELEYSCDWLAFSDAAAQWSNQLCPAYVDCTK